MMQSGSSARSFPLRRRTKRRVSSSRRAVITESRKHAAASPVVERLEERTLLSTYVVSNTNDSGAGSLRQAILDSNASGGQDLITFNIGGSGAAITLTSGQLTITDDLQINGPGASVLSVSGNNASRVFQITSGHTVVISGLTIRNGNVGSADAFSSYGGGIVNSGTLSVTQSIITGNSAARGGGIYNEGALSVDSSTVSQNSVNITGGGIENYGPATSTTIVTNSTIAFNSGTYGGGLGDDNGTTTVVSSTVYGNFASGNGGGLVGNTFILTNVTVSGNSSPFGGGIQAGCCVSMTNTLVAGNTATTSGPDFNGSGSGTYNLIGNGTGTSGFTNGVSGNQVGTSGSPIDARLGPLADNSGTTKTLALMFGSPAINAGNTGAAPFLDQRGVARVGTADIGAFEADRNYFVVSNTADSGANSLRQAITDANSTANLTAGADVIQFNIAGSGVRTISPTSILPSITEAVTIDGYSQPGSSANTLATGDNAAPLIQLDGTSAGGSASGITLSSSGSTIKGLVINHFGSHGVVLSGAGVSGNVVQGNFIGTDATGTSAIPNGGHGVLVAAGAVGNTIGGSVAAARNIISANNSDGVHIQDPTTTGTVVQGNFLGVDANGRSHGPSVVAWWKAENTAVDAISGITGTLQNGASYAAGQVGQAFAFTNDATSNDQVALVGSANGALNFTGTALTIEGWVYQNSASQTNNQWGIQTIIGKWFDTADNGYLLQTVNGVLTLSLVTSTGRTDIAATSAIPLNTWVHVAATYDGETMRLFQNSGQVASAAKTGNITHSNNDATIGNVGTNFGWKGLIDELTAYGRAADIAEIKSIYDAGATGKANMMGNAGEGVEIDRAVGSTIGGTTATPGTGAGNVVGGNRTGSGIWIHSNGSALNMATAVQGNLIGTNSTGLAPVPNRTDGVTITNGATNTTIGGTTSGLGNVISGNGSEAIYVGGTNSSNNLIAGNTVGLDINGTQMLQNRWSNIEISSNDNTIGGNTTAARNVIGGGRDGIILNGSGAHHNLIAGNYVGTDRTGMFARPTTFKGISIVDANSNTVGGLTATPGTGLGNLLSGNGSEGIFMYGSGTTGNVIQGNLVGSDATGLAPLGNNTGIYVWNGPSNNTIGGSVTTARNIISGNRGSGMYITSSNSSGNLIQGNYVGLDVNGRTLGPAAAVWYKAENNTFDTINSLTAALTNGAAYAAGEVGQAFSFDGVDDEVVIPNTATSGALAITGTELTIEAWVYQTASANPAGGVQAIFDKWALSSGYLLGTTAGNLTARLATTSNSSFSLTAPSALPLNTWVHVAMTFGDGVVKLFQNGVQVASGSLSGNIINQTNDASIGNDNNPGLSNAGWSGLIDELSVYSRIADVLELKAIFDSGSTGKANQMGNFYQGIEIAGAVGNTIGGATGSNPTGTAPGNVIGGSRNGTGIYIHGDGVTAADINTVVQGNILGADPTGTKPEPNRFSGMYVSDGARKVTIGGTAAGAGNLISGNTYAGIAVTTNFSSLPGSQVLIQGNIIGLALDGSTVLANTHEGVWNYNAPNNTYGGSTPAARNIIAGNRTVGLQLGGTGSTTSVVVTGNYIGTDSTGTLDRGNGQIGINIWGGSHHNTIGGQTSTPGAGLGNVISGNDTHGIEVNASPDNWILGNIVGLNASGTASLGNTSFGISLLGGSLRTRIGTDSDGNGDTDERNVISSNAKGINITGAGTNQTTIAGNYIGTDITGTIDLGNAQEGILLITSGGVGTTIGGTAAAARNVISGNNSEGIEFSNVLAVSSLVVNNYIGLDVSGTFPIGNGPDGLLIRGTSGVTVGGTTAAERNVISANGSAGVDIRDANSFGNVVRGNYIGTNKDGTDVLLGAISWWKGENNPNDSADSNTGTVAGNAAYAAGKVGQAFSLDGAGDAIQITNATNLQVQNFTIEAWVKRGSATQISLDESVDPGGMVFSYGAGGYGFGLLDDGRLFLSKVGTSSVTSTGAVTDTNFHHVAVTKSGSTVTFYVDGVGVVASAFSDTFTFTTNAAIGARGGTLTNSFLGLIDQVHLNGRVLSASEIQAIINAGTRGQGLGNAGHGVLIQTGAHNNTIGGSQSFSDLGPGNRNIISGNFAAGVRVDGATTADNVLQGNFIGVDVSGNARIANATLGVWLVSPLRTIIGTDSNGTNDGIEGNIISGNSSFAQIFIESSPQQTVVAGNIIGLGYDGNTVIGTSGASHGMEIKNGSIDTRVGTDSNGTSDTEERNIISGNTSNGIFVWAMGTDRTLIAGNYIGPDITGLLDRGNAANGINVSTGVSNTTVGGTTSAARNIISGNNGVGISVSDGGTGGTVRTLGTVIQGNYIGTTKNGDAPLGNSGVGLTVNSSTQTTIGGTVAGAGNVISGGLAGGASLTSPAEAYAGGDPIRFAGADANPGRVAIGTVSNDRDLFAEVFSTYTSTDLWIAVRVQDDFIDAQAGDAATPFLNDSVELFIDGDRAANDFTAGGNNEGFQLIADSLGNKFTSAGGAFTNANWSVATTTFSGNFVGYSIEFRIPLSLIDTQDGAGFTAAGPGSNLRFNVAITDNDAAVSAQQAYGILWRNGTQLPAAAGESAWVADLYLDNFAAVSSTAPFLLSAPLRTTAMTLDAQIGAGTAGNLAAGNIVGLKYDGTTSISSTGVGLTINNAFRNTIGGRTATTGALPGNIISGNSSQGIQFNNVNAAENVVIGNLVGLNQAGDTARPNSFGVIFFNGANHNRIGTDADGTLDSQERNVISGNLSGGDGVNMNNGDYNVVAGNYIGTDITGTTAIANADSGVAMYNGSDFNTIGGTVAAARNIIAGNAHQGFWIGGTTTGTGTPPQFNVVAGNWIGLNALANALPNGVNGVLLFDRAQNNSIGIPVTGGGNVISGNNQAGIRITKDDPADSFTGSGVAFGNSIANNIIGLDPTGTFQIHNSTGVRIEAGSTNNTVGGATTLHRNIVSGNTGVGVSVAGATTSNNLIAGNYVGTSLDGLSAVPNGNSGILLDGHHNTIGGLTATAGTGLGNVASGNTLAGIAFQFSGAQSNVVIGNLVGLKADGSAALPNMASGVAIVDGGNLNTIGGTAAGSRNVISGNNGYGIALGPYSSANGTPNNAILGNYVGTNIAGTAAMPNVGPGIALLSTTGTGTTGNIIGGTSASSRNVIGGNTGAGIEITGTGSANNTVRGNYIGTDSSGTLPIANARGIFISGPNNTIGGIAAGETNRIAYNLGAGVAVGSATGNLLRGNSTYQNAGLGIDLGDDGLVLSNDANDADAGQQNYPVLTGVIAGSESHVAGVLVSTPSTTLTIDIYANDSPDASGFGEGQRLVSSFTVNTDGSGVATFDRLLGSIALGEFVTSTATDAAGNTSEFSLGFVAGTAAGNQAPSINAVSPQSVNEGETVRVVVSAGDPDATGGLRFSLDAAPAGAAIDPDTGEFTWTANVDAPAAGLDFNVTVRVTETGLDFGEALFDTTSFTIHVQNVAPVLDPNGLSVTPTIVNENGTVTLAGTFNDPGTSETYSVTVNWGDSTPPVIVTPTLLATGVYRFDATHTYRDDNPTGTPFDSYSVQVTLSDGQSNSTLTAGSVVVNNLPPVLPSTGAGVPTLSVTTAAEGTPVTLTGSFSDTGTLDSHTVRVTWGDGFSSFATVTPAGSGQFTYSASHAYPDNSPVGSPYLVNVTVTDDDTGSSSASAGSVSVTNVTPVVQDNDLQLAPASVVFEGQGVLLGGTFADPGSGDTHTVEINWGDGSDLTTLSLSAGVTSFSNVAHAYADDPAGAADTYNIQVTVRDDENANDGAVTVVTVHNSAPVLFDSDLELSVPSPIDEGTSVVLRGPIVDAGTRDAHTVTINWGDGSPLTTLSLSAGIAAFEAAHTFADDSPSGTAADPYSIRVTVSDDDGGSSGEAIMPIMVENVAPTLEITTGPGNNDTQVHLVATVSDVGVLDTFRYAWSTTVSPTACAAVPPKIEPPIGFIPNRTSEYTFPKQPNCTYTVTLTASDDDAGNVTKTYLFFSGTPNDDSITITNSAQPGQVDVAIGGVPAGTFNSADGIIVSGGGGNDTINASGTSVPSLLDGGAGNDTMVGGSGHTTFILHNGNDVAIDNSSSDDDYLMSPNSDLTVIDNGGTNNGLNFSIATFGITLDLSRTNERLDVAPVTDPGHHFVTFSGTFTRLTGSGFGDKLAGNGLSNLVFGGMGVDEISGGGGDDIIFGGTGGALVNDPAIDIIFGGTSAISVDADGSNDIIFGGLGFDRIDGGAGDDIIFGGTGGALASGGTVGGSGGAPTGTLPDGTGLGFGGTTISNTDDDLSSDIIFGGLGRDSIDGGAGADIIFGGTGLGVSDTDAGADIIFGGMGLDNIDGGSGNDIIFGGMQPGSSQNDTSSDIIFGGMGLDQIDGGDGDDIIFGGTGGALGGVNDDSNPSNDIIFGGVGGVPAGTIDADASSDIIFGGRGTDLVDGGSGDDIIFGGTAGVMSNGSDADTAPDIIFGGLGIDVIDGGQGADIIFGGTGGALADDGGLDIIFGGSSISTGDADTGNDIIFGGVGLDSIDGGSGNDIIFGGTGGRVADLNGDGTSDIIFGGVQVGLSDGVDSSGGTDVIFGGLGSDRIDGGVGDDIIFGGTGGALADDGGLDIIFGGASISPLDGDAGNDIIFGGVGLDSVDGGAGNDIIFGGTGGALNGTADTDAGSGDIIFGGLGVDSIDGGLGDDIIFGGTGGALAEDAGLDIIFGGASIATSDSDNGNSSDIIFGGLGLDSIDGGAGDDIIFGGTGGAVADRDGNGTSDIIFGGTAVALSDSPDSSGGSDIIFGGLGLDRIDGGGGDDIIFGGTGGTLADDAAIDIIFGGTVASNDTDTGSDIIFGGMGQDHIDGGVGNDIIFGGTAGGVADGDAGSADIIFGGMGLDSIDGGSGNDIIFGGTGGTLADDGGIDIVFGGTVATSDTDAGAGDVIFGGVGLDSIDGGSGDDIIFGGTGGVITGTPDADSGQDIIFGGTGADLIDAGAGNDIIFGGTGGALGDDPGIDVIFGGSTIPTNDIDIGSSDIIFGGTGLDSIDGGSGNDIIFGGTGGTLAGALDSDPESDIIFGGVAVSTSDGDTGADVIYGGMGLDRVDGGRGDDIIFGGTGAGTGDTDSGSDIIFGGVGVDRIDGGNGNDIIFGGTGGSLMGTVDTDTGGDIIFGGVGVDRIDAGTGDDVVFGGTGAGLGTAVDADGSSDIIFGGVGVDSIAGGSGDDIIFGGTGAGTNDTDGSGSDIIFGGMGLDQIDGGGGNDIIFGGTGGQLVNDSDVPNDIVFGGVTITISTSDGDASVDLIFGGLGLDSIDGGTGDDIIFGGTGGGMAGSLDSDPDSDIIFGGLPVNTFDVDTGDDVIFGGMGSDSVDGGAGSDIIFGGTGGAMSGTSDSDPSSDIIFGGVGMDSIDGGSGSDIIFGGTTGVFLGGADSEPGAAVGGSNDIIFGGLGIDRIDGGVGDDIIFGGTGGAAADLNDNGSSDIIFGGSAVSLSDSNDSAGGDIIFGGVGLDRIDGGTGDDLIFGGVGGVFAGTSDADATATGADIIFGGLGLDRIDGGVGPDIIFGGTAHGAADADLAGDDVIYGGIGLDNVDAGRGDDIVFGGTAGGVADADDVGGDIIFGGIGLDQVDGGDGNDIVFGGTGPSSNDADTAGADVIFGGMGIDSIEAGAGDDIVFGGVSSGTGDTDGSGDIIFGGLGHDQVDGGDGADIVFGGTGGELLGDSGVPNDIIFGGTLVSTGETDQDASSDIIFGGLGADLLDGGAGPDVIFGGVVSSGADPDASNDIIYGGPGNDSLNGGFGNDSIYGGTGDDQITGYFGDDSTAGGLGSDTYVFPSNFGADVIDEPPNVDNDSLDFSAFNIACNPQVATCGINLDLARAGVQVLTGTGSPSSLSLTFTSPTGIENVTGTRFADTILGNARDNQLLGADALRAAGTAAPPSGPGAQQVVFLDFDTETSSGEHAYTSDERNLVLAQMRQVYAAFGFVSFTLVRPTSGAYATLFFNKPPDGGLADEIDWRNLNLDKTASIDVHAFLGGPGQPAATSDNIVRFSATVAAHELGHLMGLRHSDSFGPIGSGMHDPPGADSLLPTYAGPVAAVETSMHVMASPDSVGSSLFDAVATPFFGEREATKLAFISSGVTVNEQGTHRTIATAQALDLYALPVPNTLAKGSDVGKDFSVAAVDVVGSIQLDPATSKSESDFYRFAGLAGDVMNIEVMSTVLDRILHSTEGSIDSVLRVWRVVSGVAEKVPYYGSALKAFNDNEFEKLDSILVDFVLPADGQYFIEIDTFSFNTPEFASYKPADFNAVAYCNDPVTSSDVACSDTDTGLYELFMYRFDAADGVDSGDSLVGRAGNDVLKGGGGNDSLDGGAGDDVLNGDDGNDTFVFGADASGSDVVSGGAGTNQLDTSGSNGGASFSSTDLPVLSLPANIVREAEGPSGASASFSVTAIDPNDGALTPSCNHSVTETFPLGITVVTCSVTDSSGNTVTGSFKITVKDTTAPNTTVTIHPSNPSNSASASFQFTSTESGIFECRLDGAAFAVCTSPKSYSGLADGSHTFEVRSQDPSGNTDESPDSYTWTVDTVAPNTTITTKPANPSGSANATFEFNSNESGSTFQCRLDAAAFASCTSPVSYTNLADGSHTFQVRATDVAANTDVTPDSYTWAVTASTVRSIYVLNSTLCGALTMSGNAVVDMEGDVVVSSNCSSAIAASGNAQIEGASIRVVGGVQKSGNATLSPQPITGVTATTDPLIGLSAPSATDLTARSAVNCSGNTAQTLQPGIYPSIQASGNCSLTLQPGTYVLKGGGLSISGNAGAVVAAGTGNSVLIYNAGSNYPNAGGTFGAINLSGNGNFNLTPASSGAYAGTVMFQSRDNTKAASLSGNATLGGLKGVIYAPAAQLTLSGNGSLKATLIVDNLRLSGNASSSLSTGGTPPAGDAQAILAAGQLRTGVLWVAIDDSNGAMDADQKTRIRDGIAQINATFDDYGVSLVEVDAGSGVATDIRISVAATSACGTHDDGILGCTTIFGDITLMTGWNWYAGAEANQVGTQQFDLQTIITHELGHAIGAEHSADAQSVMYTSLTRGVARRGFTEQDLALLADGNGGGGGGSLTAALHVDVAGDGGLSGNAPCPICGQVHGGAHSGEVGGMVFSVIRVAPEPVAEPGQDIVISGGLMGTELGAVDRRLPVVDPSRAVDRRPFGSVIDQPMSGRRGDVGFDLDIADDLRSTRAPRQANIDEWLGDRTNIESTRSRAAYEHDEGVARADAAIVDDLAVRLTDVVTESRARDLLLFGRLGD
jgi:Ca2+-binding RTX toxin-like protein